MVVLVMLRLRWCRHGHVAHQGQRVHVEDALADIGGEGTA